MHAKVFKLTLNTLLFVGLLMIFLIPIGSVGMAGLNTDPSVLSAQDTRKIQKPRNQIILDNAEKLDDEEEEDNKDYRPY